MLNTLIVLYLGVVFIPFYFVWNRRYADLESFEDVKSNAGGILLMFVALVAVMALGLYAIEIGDRYVF